MKRFFFLIGLLLTLTHLNAEEDGDVNSIPLPAIYFANPNSPISVINPSANPPGVVKEVLNYRAFDMVSVRAMSVNSEGFSYYIYAIQANGILVINAVEGNVIGTIDLAEYGYNGIAITSVIANGIPYIYCACGDFSDNYFIIVINANEFAKNPKQPEKFIVKTIRVEASPVALESAILDATPYVYCLCGSERAQVTFINANTQKKEGTVVLPRYAGGPLAMTVAFKSGDTTPFLYCSCFNDALFTVSAKSRKHFKVRVPEEGYDGESLTSTGRFVYVSLEDGVGVIDPNTNDVVKQISLDTLTYSLTPVRVNGIPYVYVFDSEGVVNIIKEVGGETVAEVVGSIKLKDYADFSTTVEPTRDASVNNTSAHQALKGGGFGGG